MLSKLKGGGRSVATQASKLGVMPQIHAEGLAVEDCVSRISSPQCIAPKKLIIATAYELNAWLMNSCDTCWGQKKCRRQRNKGNQACISQQISPHRWTTYRRFILVHDYWEGLLVTFVESTFASAKGLGSHCLSPSHFCPHQQYPSELMRHLSLPQQRWSSCMVKRLLKF